jgi:zinc metalloprotease ZmpB
MTSRNLLQLLTLFLLFATTTVWAQKPMTTSPLTISLQPEDDASYMRGNMRVLARSGYPAAVYGAYAPVVPARPELMARQYLAQHLSTFGLTMGDLQNLRLHAVQEDAAGTVVRLRQTWKGLPVNNNAEITIHISPAFVVDFVMNGFQYGVQLNNVTPVLDAAAARAKLASHLGISGTVSGESNRLEVLRYMGNDYLVYRVVMATDRPVGEWEAYIDARSGALMQVADKSAYHHDRHTPARRQSPRRVTVNGTGNVFDPDPLSTARATYGGSYVDGADANAAVLTAQLRSVTLNDITLTGATYSLVGPYAVLQDFEAPNKGLFTQASSTFNFDRNADAFEAVNTYYHIDAMMRYLNITLGLAIMPYQYTGGVRFDPSGLSGADNSHYLGSSGRLAFGEGGVDDAEDADVIIHELGHGLHDWVTVGGLSQVNGLSEGTGDYIAGSYSRFKNNWLPADPGYNWMFNWDGHNPFWGGRLLNYGAVYPGGLVGQVHSDGQIWATANMKIWDDIGRQRADRAFWSGLRLTNGSSNQNDAAVAVFQAATTLGYTNTERLAIYNRFTAAGYTLPIFVALPVQLHSFTAHKAGDRAMVKWSTATESASSQFIVERAIDGRNFVAIGTVPAAGNSQVLRHYQLTDAAPMPGINYYRLKQTNLDGSASYSGIATVTFSKKITLHISPNPVKEALVLQQKFSAAHLSVYDAGGRLVLTKSLGSTTAGGNTRIPLGHLTSGMYFVKLLADGQLLEGKFYKSR